MNHKLKVVFPAKWEALEIADDIFNAIANSATSDCRKAYHIRTVLSEAFSNAYLYGDNDSQNAAIVFDICFNPETFIASIINCGNGFADTDIKWNEFPCSDEESGRGLKIIKQLCDKVEFKKIDNNKFRVFIEIKVNDNKKIKC